MKNSLIMGLTSLAIALLLLQSLAMQAQQTNDSKQLVNELKTASNLLGKSDYVDFELKYTYSELENPSIILDSVLGHCKIWGNRYWYRLAETETVNDGQHQVVAYNEDKVLYWSKSPEVSGLLQPMLMLDSALNGRYPFSISMKKSKIFKEYHVQFENSETVKEIICWVDSHNGNLLKIRQIANSALLQQEADEPNDSKIKWVNIDISFDKVSHLGLNPEDFSINHFVTTVGSEIQAVGKFASYSVFKASN
jgi:hypothetical protein